MFIERKEDLSLYYFLKELFNDKPFITVLDAFPDSEFTFPSVSVEAVKATAVNFELGSKVKQHYRTYQIDIFALTKTQRDEIGYLIYNALDNIIPVYNYDEGFPPSVTPTLVSALDVTDKELGNIRINPELTEQMYYRAVISIIATRNTR
jgi:hypothetical protein